MAELILDLALETASGRLITVLEGGYNLEVWKNASRGPCSGCCW